MARQQKLKRRINATTKLKIVAQLSSKSSREVAKECGVSRSNVMRWKQQADLLRALNGSACRLRGGGKKTVGEDLHAALTEKVLYERSVQRRVTRGMISTWAKEMKASMDATMTICPSWIDRFMVRSGFVLRKGTRKPVLDDDELVNRGAHFVSEVRNIVEQHNIPIDQIYNLDETAVFFDHAKQSTVHLRGAKDVPVHSFGFEKQRITAVFCASAIGTKMLPCVMSKSTSCLGEPPVAVNNGVAELKMGTSWMNSKAFIQYLQYLFPDPVPRNSILLLFDSARCHTAAEVREHLGERGILFAVVSGGMTGFCRPADFGWFAQLKSQLVKSIDGWKRDGPHEHTRGGRVKPPPGRIVAKWLTDAWATVQANTIQVSFTRCALGSDTDLHLSRHERLGPMSQHKLRGDGDEVAHSSIVQDLSDEFDDFLVIDEH